jgi:hypothetical protein
MKQILLSVLFTLSGCATLGMRHGLGEDDIKKIKSVAVVSLLDSKMNYVFVGTTVYQNNLKFVEVKKWGLRQQAEQIAVRELKKNPQFTRVAVLDKPNPGPDANAKDGYKTLLAQAKAQGFDTLVLITPTAYDNAPLLPAGYGLEHASRFALKDHTHVYILAMARVHDTNSGERLAWQWSFDTLSGDPNVTSNESVPWKDSPDDMTPPERDLVHKAMVNLLDRQITYSMGALNLSKQRL